MSSDFGFGTSIHPRHINHSNVQVFGGKGARIKTCVMRKMMVCDPLNTEREPAGPHTQKEQSIVLYYRLNRRSLTLVISTLSPYDWSCPTKGQTDAKYSVHHLFPSHLSRLSQVIETQQERLIGCIARQPEPRSLFEASMTRLWSLWGAWRCMNRS